MSKRRRAVNPNQFAMFMSPKEVLHSYQPNPYDIEAGDEDEDGMMDRKLAEAQEEPEGYVEKDRRYVASPLTLSESIAAGGVREPVELFEGDAKQDRPPWIRNGHHRVVAQMDADPNRLMPVLHHRTPYQGGP